MASRRLEGSRVLLTGASRGIGQALAMRLAEKGAKLLLLGRDAARLAALNARIARIVGDAKERPTWNAGDFFGGKFGAGAP